MRILVTGAAGFIGAQLSLRLLERGDEVVGIDCLDPYYDVELKKARLARLTIFPGFADLRIRLEEIAIDYAVADGPPREIRRLKAAFDAYLAYQPKLYDAKLFTLDSGFHKTIAVLGGNDFLVKMLEQFYLTAWMSVNVMLFTPLVDRFRTEHRAIYDAIARGDGKTAKTILRKHLEAARTAVAAASTDLVEIDIFSST